MAEYEQRRPQEVRHQVKVCAQRAEGKDEGGTCGARALQCNASLECVKTLLSLLVTDSLPGLETDELELAILDICRAHFMPKAEQELYIELPPEDQEPGQDLVGRLNRMMCGFRDTSNRWMRDWQALGKANGALFLH